MSAALVLQVLEQYDHEIGQARAAVDALALDDRAYLTGYVRSLEWARAVLERQALSVGELPTAIRA